MGQTELKTETLTHWWFEGSDTCDTCGLERNEVNALLTNAKDNSMRYLVDGVWIKKEPPCHKVEL